LLKHKLVFAFLCYVKNHDVLFNLLKTKWKFS